MDYRRRRAAVAWFAVFVTSTAIAYSSAISAPFVFDDIPAIQQNLSIRQLVPLSEPLNPPPLSPVSGRPVVNLSLAVNHAIAARLSNEQEASASKAGYTLGYHLFNVAVHLVCGMLLFATIRRTMDRLPESGPRIGSDHLAGFATLLWLVHPVQTEAVDYVIQRTELMVSAFYLATLYASIRAWDARNDATRRTWFAVGLATCALGMASKEVMATAPFIVVLYDRAFRASSWNELFRNRSRVLFYTGLLAVALLLFVSVALNVRAASVGFGLGVKWYEYLYTQAWAVAHYLRLIVWPGGLTFDYGDRMITGLRGLPGLLLLVPLAIATAFAWTRSRWLWLGFLGAWFFVILAPSSSIVPIKTEIAAERRVYLASAAVFVLVVLATQWFRGRVRAPVATERVILGGVTVVLMALTFTRGLAYADPERLFRDNVASTPRNPRAHVGLGLTLAARGPQRLDEAEDSFRHAIALDPSNFVAWRTLGVLKLMQGQWREAVPLLERALELSPGNLDVTVGLARAHVEIGQADAAMSYVDRIGTVDLDLLWSLGALLVEEGRGAAALPYLERAAEVTDPTARALALLSLAYAQSGNASRARLAAQVATASAGDTAEVFVLAGRAMLAAGRPREAGLYLRHALQLDPTSSSARKALNSMERLSRK